MRFYATWMLWLAMTPIPVSWASAPPMGGGILDAGFQGEYYSNPTLSGAPAFTRKDLRVNFDWKDVLPVGGSTMPGMADFPTDNYSVRWTGQVVARVSETYTFKVVSDEGARFYIRPEGVTEWTLLVDHWAAHTETTNAAAYAMTAGVRYDVKLEYWEGTGNAVIALRWSSPQTPEEVIDVVSTYSNNAYSYIGTMFADAVWGASAAANQWSTTNLDTNGWPLEDGYFSIHYQIYTSSFPGRWLLQFTGKAMVIAKNGGTILFNADGLTYTNKVPSGVGYDSVNNVTTLPFDALTRVQSMQFSNSQRTASSPLKSGVTNVRLMMPVSGGATNYCPLGTVVNPPTKDGYSQYTTIRYQSANLGWASINWSQRTLPSYCGTIDKSAAANGNGGFCIEKLIMAANEMGRDLYFIYGTKINQAFMTNIARLAQFGSDGVNPYTHYVAHPVYPPLNPNLRLYLEHGNEEGWSAVQGLPPDWPTIMASEDGTILNYDGKYPNGGGSSGEGFMRWHALRSLQMGRACRAVAGDARMNDRFRVYLFGQYSGQQLNLCGQFLDNYFNNGDGVSHVSDPHPPSYYVWGGGGATYYFSTNPYGLSPTVDFADSGFETLDVTNGTAALRPSGTAWTFTGNAGICDVRLARSGIVTNQTLGALTHNSAGSSRWYGCKLTVGSKDVYVYELGRWNPAGNLSTNYLRFYKPNGESLLGQWNGVYVTNTASSGYVYQPVMLYGENEPGSDRFAPARLLAGQTYYLLSQEAANNQSSFYNATTAVAPRGITIEGAVEYSGSGSNFTMTAVGSYSYGPLNMICADAPLETVDGYVGVPPDETYDPSRTNRVGVQCAFLSGTGSISQVVNFPNTGVYFCALQAAKSQPVANTYNVYFDATLVSSNKSATKGGATAGTMYDFMSSLFTNTVVGPHTIRFQGMSTNNGVVFFDTIHLGDREEFFGGPGATNFPSGGGTAMSENTDESFQKRVEAECNMARTWGWVPATYEGGMAVGGDFGRSGMDAYPQLRSWDPYVIRAEQNAQDLWTWAGGHLLTVFYPQWYPTETYLSNPTNSMLVKATMDYNRRWTMEPGNGILAPVVLTPLDKHYSGSPTTYNRGSFATSVPAYGWMSWSVIIPSGGTYRVTAATTPVGGQTQVVADDATVIASGPSGSDVSGTVFLTKGVHMLRVKSTGGSFEVQGVRVQPEGAPTGEPPSLSASDNGTNIVLNWSAVDGATGYLVRYGASADALTHEVDVGSATSLTLSNLADGRYYLRVYGYNGSGLGLSSERVVQVLTTGTEGALAHWEFATNVGDEPWVYPTAYVQWLGGVSALKRGSGVTPYANTDTYCFNVVTSTNLAHAVSLNEYVEFTVTPAVGRQLSVHQMQFRPFWEKWGTNLPGAGLAYSVNGGVFSSPLPASGTPQDNPNVNTSLYSLDLSGETALQATTNAITFRLYFFGAKDNGTSCGLGGVGDDLVLFGQYTVTSTNQPPTLFNAAIATPSLIGGTNTTLTVLGADDGGEPSLKYTWSVFRKPKNVADPTFSTNGVNAAKSVTAKFSTAGDYGFRVLITDLEGLSAYSEVSAYVTQTLASVVSLPLGARVHPGITERYGVTVYNQFGARFSAQPSWTWSLDGEGKVDASSGRYTAPVSGSVVETLTATAPIWGLSNSFPVTVPAGELGVWGARGDVGNVAITGSASCASGVYTLIGSGNSLGVSNDQFQFVRQAVQGNFEMIARVQSLTRTQARAGLLAREHLGTDAKSFLVSVDASNYNKANTNTLYQYYRSVEGDACKSANTTIPTAAPWVRMTRVGDVFTSYASTNGTDWTLTGSARTIAMTNPVEVGLALSGNGGVCTAVFQSVTLLTHPSVCVIASVSDASEWGTDREGIFTLQRVGNLSSNLTVSFAITGAASNGVDYALLPTEITLPAGVAATNLLVTPMADTEAEGEETVGMTLLPSADYDLATPSNATVVIHDRPMDQWRFAQFGADANHPDIAGDTADPDHDGINNLLEYALGMEPLVAGTMGLPVSGRDGDHLTLTYQKGREDVTYTVEVSGEPGSGWTNAGVTEVDLGGGNTKAIDPATITGNAKRFIRLKVTNIK